MLVSFTVSNYRSFKHEVLFAMMPSSQVGHVHPAHLTAGGGSQNRRNLRRERRGEIEFV